jgi:hypothetical protein
LHGPETASAALLPQVVVAGAVARKRKAASCSTIALVEQPEWAGRLVAALAVQNKQLAGCNNRRPIEFATSLNIHSAKCMIAPRHCRCRIICAFAVFTRTLLGSLNFDKH